jgi:hypothetical protein
MRLLLNEDENVSQNYLTMLLTIPERMVIMAEEAVRRGKSRCAVMAALSATDIHHNFLAGRRMQ